MKSTQEQPSHVLSTQDIIDKMIAAGYGWRKYAESISKQSTITDKQLSTLYEMHRKLQAQQSAAEMRSRWKPSMRTYEDKFTASLDHDQVGEWGEPEWN
jgi:hypothetical protein